MWNGGKGHSPFDGGRRADAEGTGEARNPELRSDGRGSVRRMLVVIAATVVVSAATARAVEVIDRVLAVVGGTVITQSDARAALVFGLVRPPATPGADPLRATLDQLIRRELILAEVNRYASDQADASIVERQMAAIRGRFPSEAAYRAALAANAMTEERLRDIVDADVRIDEYIQQRFGAGAEPTDDEIAEYYSSHRAELTGGGQPLTLDQARPRIRQQLIEEKRAAAIDQWVTRLRRRTDVTDLYFGGRSPSTGVSPA
jgi:hypothetical protein